MGIPVSGLTETLLRERPVIVRRIKAKVNTHGQAFGPRKSLYSFGDRLQHQIESGLLNPPTRDPLRGKRPMTRGRDQKMDVRRA